MNMVPTVIGYVKKSEDETVHIEIEKQFWNGVLQLNKFSHMIVLWWITERDNPENRAILQVMPPVEGAQLSGVFASRSPNRPTPIGHTIVAIMSINERKHAIEIDHMDAFDGSPVIDIKPYMPSSDKVDNAKVPSWFAKNVRRYTQSE